MESQGSKVYTYRWVVLFVFALANAMIQIHWVNYAPITTKAALYYGVTPLKIGALSMLYMTVFLVFCIPASYVIDTYGIKVGVGFGAILTAIFGVMKAIFPDNYQMIFYAYIGLAIAQPFIMNAMTKVGANWFPIRERAMAVGLAALSQYIGISLAMGLTPFLVNAYGMEGMLNIYAVASVITSLFFLLLCRDRPDLPPDIETSAERIAVFAGLKNIFKDRDMIMVLFIFFIGLGMFNAVTTWIEQILAPRGLTSEQAGLIGTALMLGGILGAIILPIMSDIKRKRKPFLIICMAGMFPGLIGLTFVTSFAWLAASAFVMGFFIMAAGPIGFQYGAEISYPVPESTSQGMILLSGQISGIIFILMMDKFRLSDGSMTPFMIAFIVMMLAVVVLTLRLRESPLILADGRPVQPVNKD
ncbi:MAG: MFS transporter [Thermodesulfobacteriota bacterium]|nr:MFS transporter [Thermodesulfobacteriota bacterium]